LAVELRRISAFFFALIFIVAAFGEGTRNWEQSKFEDLTRGTARGVAIRSTGGLELAPSFLQVYASPSTYIWSIAADAQGNIYAAAGSPARLYRIDVKGGATAIFEPQELQVQSLVVDPTGIIYAATSPDGKVYKVEAKGVEPKGKKNAKAAEAAPVSWTSSVYFDPGTKYIWDLQLDDKGDLYVATGDKGEIYRVAPNGEHSLFFKSDEVHIRTLAMDHKGNLIAGSDGSGLVYRISPRGEGFVLYSAPKKEITALAVDEAGNIYAAAAGEKRGSTTQAPVSITAITPAAQIPLSLPAPGQAPAGLPPAPAPIISFPAAGLAASGSEIYRIAPDGSPLRIWTSPTDLVYALTFDQHGNLLAGTGNRGHVFAITGRDEFVDLLKAGSSQVTAFARSPQGGVYASTSNLGKLFVVGPNLATEGTYESDVFDAHTFSRWGRAEYRGYGNVQLFARSGNVDNPDRNWSPWSQVDLTKNATLPVPSARFMQWKAVLRASNPEPQISSVSINYLPKNVAPEIDDVTVSPGMRYPQVIKQPNADPASASIPSPVRDRDAISVRWNAQDPNDDELTYSLYYRGDTENRWLLLKDEIADKYYSFDAGLLPDGGYTIRVVASDARSHSPGDALTSEKQSIRFEVDTTPPRIENLNASVEGNRWIHVSFHASDGFSPLKRAEYSLDAGDWEYVEPINQISDDKVESYDFRVPLPDTASDPGAAGRAVLAHPPVDHVVVVRSYDRFDNMATGKILIH
jgi:sugar lactone lactonase YvrE